LLPYRELDDALGLTDTACDLLADARTGKNGRHRLTGLLRQSVFGRLAGYEDVNDADRLCRDPAGRFWIHRLLESNGIESHVVEPASIVVPRRHRRAKTDVIDGEMLVRSLTASSGESHASAR
jgi:transposase